MQVRHVKSTSIAEYYAVGDTKLVTVRQSNLNGVICCLTCLVTRCPHVSAVADHLLSGGETAKEAVA
jgi:hypothetical protein